MAKFLWLTMKDATPNDIFINADQISSMRLLDDGTILWMANGDIIEVEETLDNNMLNLFNDVVFFFMFFYC